jgi:hypothetical protein
MRGSSGTPPARLRARDDGRWWSVPRELLLVLASVVFYFGVRGLTHTEPAQALDNAHDIVNLEKSLGLYVEPALQETTTDSHTLMTLMNWIYIWGHWPVITAVLLWLCVRHPEGYRQVRTTMVLSGGIGLVVFALYPVAPPRLARLGFVDTVTELSTSYRVLQPPALVNQYAAMPSLHVGWDLLMGFALVTWGGHRALRLLGVLLPLAMVSAVILTANHYVLDAVAGASLVLACLVVVRSRMPAQADVDLPAQRTGSSRQPARDVRPRC